MGITKTFKIKNNIDYLKDRLNNELLDTKKIN